MNKNVGNFYHQMGIMLNTGLPITRSLETTAEGLRGRVKRSVNFILEEVSSGSTVSQAMKKKRLFSPFDTTMIEAAEESGNLAETFKTLSQWYDFCLSIKRKMLSGFALPVAIIHAVIFIIPLPYVFIGKVSFSRYSFGVLTSLLNIWGTLFIAYWIMRLWPNRGILREIFDALLLRIPVFGRAVKLMSYGRFCKSFYLLYSSGIPIITASEMAVKMTGNSIISKQLAPAAANARNGRVMHKGFTGSVPLEIRNLWSVGEESGELDNASKKLAEIYEESAQRWFTEFASWLPRIVYFLLLIILAGIVVISFSYIYGDALK